MVGRRRVGKTTLLKRAFEKKSVLYFFVAKKNEVLLCEEFTREVEDKLGVALGRLQNFASLFKAIMVLSSERNFTLIIDEFQEFFYINPTIYSKMQDIWDRYKDSTFVNFVASGSVYTLMNQIFMDSREPLYGRCDSIIKLRPFSTSVLKEILYDHKPDYTHEDLLALYTFTGGVPKYIDLFMQKGCTDMESMVDYIVQFDSPFLNEGKALLIQDFATKS